MPFDINSFKGAFRYGGLRPSLFEIQITNPVDGTSDPLMPLRCQAASIPEMTLPMIEQSFKGRTIKVASNARTYPDWTVTVVEDEDMVIRNAFETWNASINSPEGNVREFSTSAMAEYKSTGLVTLFSQTEQPLRSYQMIGAVPTTLGAITLGWDQGSAIATYDITFSYDYWIPGPGTTGAMGNII